MKLINLYVALGLMETKYRHKYNDLTDDVATFWPKDRDKAELAIFLLKERYPSAYLYMEDNSFPHIKMSMPEAHHFIHTFYKVNNLTLSSPNPPNIPFKIGCELKFNIPIDYPISHFRDINTKLSFVYGAFLKTGEIKDNSIIFPHNNGLTTIMKIYEQWVAQFKDEEYYRTKNLENKIYADMGSYLYETVHGSYYMSSSTTRLIINNPTLLEFIKNQQNDTR